MGKKLSPSERVRDVMAVALASQNQRLVTRLQNEFSGSDRSDASTATWYEIIRSRWADPAPVQVGKAQYPNWRAAQADRMGVVAFVKDALAAFGLPKNSLTTSLTDPTMAEGAHTDPSQPLPLEPQ